MASKILAIARLTFRAALNEKLLQLTAVFALALIVMSLALGDLGPRANAKIIVDFGLGTIQAMAVLIAIVLAANDMPKELERRTLYVVLSKPIDRASLIVGKLLGWYASLALLMGIMGCVFYGMLVVAHQALSPLYAVAIAMSALETFIIVGMAVLFSLVTSATLASLYTLFFFLLGHQTGVIRTFGRDSKGMAHVVSEAIYRIIPNLEAINVKNEVVYGVLPPTGQLWAGLVYALCLIVALTGLSVLIFQRKEF